MNLKRGLWEARRWLLGFLIFAGTSMSSGVIGNRTDFLFLKSLGFMTWVWDSSNRYVQFTIAIGAIAVLASLVYVVWISPPEPEPVEKHREYLAARESFQKAESKHLYYLEAVLEEASRPRNDGAFSVVGASDNREMKYEKLDKELAVQKLDYFTWAVHKFAVMDQEYFRHLLHHEEERHLGTKDGLGNYLQEVARYYGRIYSVDSVAISVLVKTKGEFELVSSVNTTYHYSPDTGAEILITELSGSLLHRVFEKREVYALDTHMSGSGDSFPPNSHAHIVGLPLYGANRIIGAMVISSPNTPENSDFFDINGFPMGMIMARVSLLLSILLKDAKP